jgi:hypothetical protein
LIESINCISSAASAWPANNSANDNAAKRVMDEIKRMEIPLGLTAPMMRDIPPASAMPFRAEIQFIRCLLE